MQFGICSLGIAITVDSRWGFAITVDSRVGFAITVVSRLGFSMPFVTFEFSLSNAKRMSKKRECVFKEQNSEILMNYACVINEVK